jgi:hypothetical protein
MATSGLAFRLLSASASTWIGCRVVVSPEWRGLDEDGEYMEAERRHYE